MIPITKPFMPPQKEYEEYLKGIWQREYLTNNGPLVQGLEKDLENYLKVDHMRFVSNGTMALQIAIKALGLEGEVITTPFSYVATTSSIVWEGAKPVFVDIDPETLNINPAAIEKAITPNTTGIVATHVYGNPCDIEAIEKIANQYDLKVIYDAAHCFGGQYKGQSVFHYGDISVVSFHATKLFHTTEGGGLVTCDPELEHKISRLRNFGHDGPGEFDGVGINGKNSEYHAAMGLCNLKYIDEIMERRKNQWLRYISLLRNENTRGIKLNPKAHFNYAYFPLIFESEERLLHVKQSLEENEIYPRRYFYPSLNELDYVEYKPAPHAESISKRILCLPLYHGLKAEEQDQIIGIINKYELAKVS
ncbi:DegT/DnrJ/EryC1/StrS family aminotransferase [Aliifodinibius halophilus]|uniref:DegT/DnrJ/EryC1/StrS family aminotransferase n=2 Tax=Fodinibius halophilus TaxID=1736908 RepID=A0A6M1T5U8_9BACT|nr:DegT/DnrJ/EryC1/StrS family aminotransferase [Fodinibius halophilus]NGP87361.1 DegT/DnrJ/EryC1/StrS family aminotransferase [Fodinibius halophilus]